jgi:hypothetical protein
MEHAVIDDGGKDLPLNLDYYSTSYELIQPHIGKGSHNSRYENSCWGIAAHAMYNRNTPQDRKFISNFSSLFECETNVRQLYSYS